MGTPRGFANGGTSDVYVAVYGQTPAGVAATDGIYRACDLTTNSGGTYEERDTGIAAGDLGRIPPASISRDETRNEAVAMAMTAREAWLALTLTLVACGSSPHGTPIDAGVDDTSADAADAGIDGPPLGDPFAALVDMPPLCSPDQWCWRRTRPAGRQ